MIDIVVRESAKRRRPGPLRSDPTGRFWTASPTESGPGRPAPQWRTSPPSPVRPARPARCGSCRCRAQHPRRVLLVAIGSGEPDELRAAGAGLARAATVPQPERRRARARGRSGCRAGRRSRARCVPIQPAERSRDRSGARRRRGADRRTRPTRSGAAIDRRPDLGRRDGVGPRSGQCPIVDQDARLAGPAGGRESSLR